jgi:hypothetical protein
MPLPLGSPFRLPGTSRPRQAKYARPAAPSSPIRLERCPSRVPASPRTRPRQSASTPTGLSKTASEPGRRCRSSLTNSNWCRNFDSTHSRTKPSPSAVSATSNCRRRMAAVLPIRVCHTRAKGSPSRRRNTTSMLCSPASCSASLDSCTPVAIRMVRTFWAETASSQVPARTTKRSPSLPRRAPNVLITSCIRPPPRAVPASRAAGPGRRPTRPLLGLRPPGSENDRPRSKLSTCQERQGSMPLRRASWPPWPAAPLSIQLPPCSPSRSVAFAGDANRWTGPTAPLSS